MFRTLKCDKDAYITNKFIEAVSAVSGNTGIAGSLDLFKLYGITRIDDVPQTELSRILLHFDLDPLRSLHNSGKLDIAHNSFFCKLILKDVYGGQTTPNNFTVDVFPLSASFDEGLGKDTAYYADHDRTNFLSSSKTSPWYGEGCTNACFSTDPGDYITSSITINSTKFSQYFKSGEEDLEIDITTLISATLKSEIPDSGFRVTFSSNIEQDQQTYYVKRFGSRHSYDETKRPKLIFGFDDSVQDDTSNLYLDTPSNLFLYNYTHSQLSNLISGSSVISGSNCIILQLKTEISGGTYSLYFTGSQHSLGTNYMTGTYSAPVNIPLSDSTINSSFLVTGSVKFTPVWQSLDNKIAYLTGSSIRAYAPQRSTKKLNPRSYVVNAIGMSSDYGSNENVTMRLNIFDANSPQIFAKKIPIELPGAVIRNCYYAIRDTSTDEYVVPFDSIKNSTKVSSDSGGMFFTFNTSVLVPLRSYAIDVLINVDGSDQKYYNVSSNFRIKNN